jgi:hypothetical protein
VIVVSQLFEGKVVFITGITLPVDGGLNLR